MAHKLHGPGNPAEGATHVEGTTAPQELEEPGRYPWHVFATKPGAGRLDQMCVLFFCITMKPCNRRAHEMTVLKIRHRLLQSHPALNRYRMQVAECYNVPVTTKESLRAEACSLLLRGVCNAGRLSGMMTGQDDWPVAYDGIQKLHFRRERTTDTSSGALHPDGFQLPCGGHAGSIEVWLPGVRARAPWWAGDRTMSLPYWQ